MRGMKFPLDIIWIKDIKVVSCSKNLPMPKTGEKAISVNSPTTVNYVVEVNAGWCGKNKIQAGNKVLGLR